MCVCAVWCGLATAVVVHHTCSFSWASPAQRCPSHGFVQKKNRQNSYSQQEKHPLLCKSCRREHFQSWRYADAVRTNSILLTFPPRFYECVVSTCFLFGSKVAEMWKARQIEFSFLSRNLVLYLKYFQQCKIFKNSLIFQ